MNCSGPHPTTRILALRHSELDIADRETHSSGVRRVGARGHHQRGRVHRGGRLRGPRGHGLAVNALGRATWPRGRGWSAPTWCTYRRIMFSTAGPPSPYVEWDEPHPLSVYGRSKLAGEQRCFLCCPALPWCAPRGLRPLRSNMVKTILRLGAGAGPLRLSTTNGLPHICRRPGRDGRALAVARMPGVFHVTNQGPTSWYGFARECGGGRRRPRTGEPIKTADLDPPRPRRGPPIRCSTTPHCGCSGSRCWPITTNPWSAPSSTCSRAVSAT